MGPEIEARLKTIFAREIASLLLYLRHAELWAEPSERPMIEKLHRLADERSAWLEQFVDRLREADVPIPAASYPMRYTSLNYLSVRAVSPSLIREEEAAIVTLRRELETFPDSSWKASLEELLRLKDSQLTELRKESTPESATT